MSKKALFAIFLFSPVLPILRFSHIFDEIYLKVKLHVKGVRKNPLAEQAQKEMFGTFDFKF